MPNESGARNKGRRPPSAHPVVAGVSRKDQHGILSSRGCESLRMIQHVCFWWAHGRAVLRQWTVAVDGSDVTFVRGMCVGVEPLQGALCPVVPWCLAWRPWTLEPWLWYLSGHLQAAACWVHGHGRLLCTILWESMYASAAARCRTFYSVFVLYIGWRAGLARWSLESRDGRHSVEPEGGCPARVASGQDTGSRGSGPDGRDLNSHRDTNRI